MSAGVARARPTGEICLARVLLLVLLLQTPARRVKSPQRTLLHTSGSDARVQRRALLGLCHWPCLSSWVGALLRRFRATLLRGPSDGQQSSPRPADQRSAPRASRRDRLSGPAIPVVIQIETLVRCPRLRPAGPARFRHTQRAMRSAAPINEDGQETKSAVWAWQISCWVAGGRRRRITVS